MLNADYYFVARFNVQVSRLKSFYGGSCTFCHEGKPPEPETVCEVESKLLPKYHSSTNFGYTGTL